MRICILIPFLYLFIMVDCKPTREQISTDTKEPKTYLPHRGNHFYVKTTDGEFVVETEKQKPLQWYLGKSGERFVLRREKIRHMK